MEPQSVECREPGVIDTLDSLEAENQRIARELHDAVGQELAAAALFAAGLQKLVDRALRRSQSNRVSDSGKFTPEHNGHAEKVPREAPVTEASGSTTSDGANRAVCCLDPSETSQLLETLTGIRRALGMASRSVRDLSHGLLLSEIDPSELPARLEELRLSLEAARSVHCEIHCLKPGQPGFELLNSERALQLLRIVQEAVSNAIRPGGADHVRVSLHGSRDCLELEVTDNGHGICQSDNCSSDDPGPANQCGGIGLRNMAYRARRIGGLLQVGCCSDGGTVVRCRVEPTESGNG